MAARKTTGKCFNCGRDAEFYSQYLGQSLCKRHFEKMLIRRARSSVVSKGYKRKGFRLKDDGTPAYRALKLIFAEDPSSDITLGTGTLEDFAVGVMVYFASGKAPKKKVGGKTGFNPLYTTSNDEIRDLLSIHGEESSEKKRIGFDNDVLSLLKDVEKRRPGGMISLVKMGERLGII